MDTIVIVIVIVVMVLETVKVNAIGRSHSHSRVQDPLQPLEIVPVLLLQVQLERVLHVLLVQVQV